MDDPKLPLSIRDTDLGFRRMTVETNVLESLYAGSSYSRASKRLLDGIRFGLNCMVLTGEAGVGKTVLLTDLAEHIPAGCQFIDILHAGEDFDRLLQCLGNRLGLSSLPADRCRALSTLRSHLIAHFEPKTRFVIAIDNAHELSLGQVRKLAGLTQLDLEQDRFVTIILSGRPTLEALLGPQQLEGHPALNAGYIHLEPLTETEVADFVDRQQQASPVKQGVVFSAGAIKRIAHHSAGSPRFVKAIYHRVLQLAPASTGERNRVSAALVDKAVAEGFSNDFAPRPRLLDKSTTLPPSQVELIAKPPRLPESSISRVLGAGRSFAETDNSQRDPQLGAQFTEPRTRVELRILPPPVAPVPAGARPDHDVAHSLKPKPNLHHGRAHTWLGYIHPARPRSVAIVLCLLALLGALLFVWAPVEDERAASRPDAMTAVEHETQRAEAPSTSVSVAASELASTSLVNEQRKLKPGEALAVTSEMAAFSPANPLKGEGRDRKDLTAGDADADRSLQQLSLLHADSAPQLTSIQATPKPSHEVATTTPVAQPSVTSADDTPAQLAASAGDACDSYEKMLELDPNDAKVRELMKSAQCEGKSAQVKRLLAQAEQQLRRKQLTKPVGNNAYETYDEVLALDPDNRTAREGFARIADGYQNLAEQRGSLKKRWEYVALGLAVKPDHDGLRTLRQELEPAVVKYFLGRGWANAREFYWDAAITNFRRVLEIDPQNTKGQKGLVSMANALVRFPRNYQSAYEQYRYVLEIDPANATARQGLQDILAYYRQGLARKPDDEDLRNMLDKVEAALGAAVAASDLGT